MKAMFLHGPGDFRLAEVAVPEPGPGEVLLEVASVGICGSDVHYWREGRIGDAVITGPHVVGHEFSAVVVGQGPGARLSSGTRVAVEPSIPCRTCSYCWDGRYNLCMNLRFFGHPPQQGAFVERVACPEFLCHPVPETFSMGDAAMVEPTAVALFALDEMCFRAGASVAVLGCGPIGLLVLQAAKAAGASDVFVSEPVAARREAALRLGADRAIDPRERDPVDAVLEATGGLGAEAVFEAAGAPDTFDQAMSLAAPGGRVVFIGIPDGDTVSLNLHTARRKALTIINVRRYRHTYRRAIRMIEQGRINVRHLVTHVFPLEDCAEAFRLLDGYHDGVIRAEIEVAGRGSKNARSA